MIKKAEDISEEQLELLFDDLVSCFAEGSPWTEEERKMARKVLLKFAKGIHQAGFDRGRDAAVNAMKKFLETPKGGEKDV